MIDRSGQAGSDRSVSALLRATRRIGLPVSAELQPSNLECSRSPFDANQPRNQESLHQEVVNGLVLLTDEIAEGTDFLEDLWLHFWNASVDAATPSNGRAAR